MQTSVLVSAALVAGLFAGSAHAMPVAHPGGAGSAATLVSGGCGPYGHRNYYGQCVANGWGGGVVVAPGFYGGGYGWHGGGYGWHGAGWHGGGWHGGGWHRGGWHGGGWHGGGHYRGGGGHWHGGGHHGGGHRR
jgi:hypothetical protein